MSKIKSSLSKKVRVSTFAGSSSTSGIRTGQVQSRLLTRKDVDQVRAEAQERVARSVAGLSDEAQKLLSEFAADTMTDDTPMEIDTGADDEDWETLPDSLKEDDNFMYAVRDIMDSRWKSRWYKDTRTWRQRTQRLHKNWDDVMDPVVDAYLTWKYPPNPKPPDCSINTAEREPDDTPTDPSAPQPFTIDVIDIYTLDATTVIPHTALSHSVTTSIVSAGYLGTSPLRPSLAISFRTLELFRRLRLRKPSFSVEAFSRVLCDLYAICFRRRWRSALHDAFEIYLNILRRINQRVMRALGRDTPNWRVLNACPPCSYELEDESPLKYERMIVIDGNNSLKRIREHGGRQIGDQRVFKDSDYYLSAEFVEQFAGEVKGSNSGTDPHTQTEHLDEDEIDGDEEINGNEETDANPDDCHKNWKSAQRDEKKKMWGIFEETGIFAAACRHGLILWLVDMVNSGELFKYPIAIIAKALDVLRCRLLCGYDIGCVFNISILNSSLSDLFTSTGSRCCVNAFHGYAHNWKCQLENHPNNIVGMGLEDLETLERLFSSSNQLAPVTRHASAFRRRLFVDAFFTQWDEDKYANIGLMLYNNYTQALEIIATESVALAEAKTSLNIQEGDLERWREEELAYFKDLGKEPEWDIHAVAYVDLLQRLREINTRYENTASKFFNATPTDYQFVTPSASTSSSNGYQLTASQTRKLETQRRRLFEQRENVTSDVIALEVKMGVTRRWEPTSPEYLETMQYMSLRNYHSALDQLQKLVIQRLFELHRLNLAHTAYKMRTHIAKSLQTRCKAIQNAVKKYNEAASALRPPRPTLDWDKVSHYSFLDEFNLLRGTRQDMSGKRWAEPAVRQTMKQASRIDRSREEIVRCHIEVRRQHTAICDEHRVFDNVLDRLKRESSIMFGPVNEYCRNRRNLNTQNLIRIKQIYSIPEYAGVKGPGIRKGQLNDMMDVHAGQTQEGIHAVMEEEAEEEAAGEEVDHDDELEGDIGGLVEYFNELPVRS